MTISAVICVGKDSTGLNRLTKSIISQSTACPILIQRNFDYPSRSLGFDLSTSDLVFFLDSDCELPDESFFARTIHFFEMNPSAQVVGGYYLNPSAAPIRTRSYNKICNTWVSIGESENLLGGVFCVRKASVRNFPSSDKFWGGEDTLLFRELKKQNINLRLEKGFSVIHHDQGSFLKLLRRAWIHGRARKRRALETPFRNKIIWKHRQRMLREFSIAEMFYAGVHLVLVEVSALLTRPYISPNK